MNRLICERSRELQQSNSQSKAPRGKRLPNKTGLNITDDNLVYTTVKENEEKKRQSQEPLLSQYSNISSTSYAVNSIKRRGRLPTKTSRANQKTTAVDSNINSNIHSVHSKTATRTFDNEVSDEF